MDQVCYKTIMLIKCGSQYCAAIIIKKMKHTVFNAMQMKLDMILSLSHSFYLTSDDIKWVSSL